VSHVTKQSNNFVAGSTALTVGSLTSSQQNDVRTSMYKYSWTNAMVAGLSGTANTLTVCTIPAKSIVKRAWLNVLTAGGGVTTLTVSLGRVATDYIDYVVASNAKAQAIYGDATAEIGTGLADLLGDLPSLTTTTDIKIRFDASSDNLSTVTTSTGEVILEITQLP
jgi:hypothetical protein